MAIDTSTIAVLNSAVLPPGDYSDCLSSREAAIFDGIQHLRRRNEWFAGRLAAKFLFLNASAPPHSCRTGEIELIHLTGEHLTRFAPSLYRQVEILRSTAPGGGPAVCWRSETLVPQTVAISHTAGTACAFLGSGRAFAVDMETRESRVTAFYNSSFTPREKSWAAVCSRSLDLDPAWVFTLLWSIKECLLKTPAFKHLSIWDVPSLEVNIMSGTEALSAPHSANEFRNSFVFLKTEVTDRYRTLHQRVAVSGTRDTVLTAIEE